MNKSPNLRRIRRVAAGISVAAILAIAGLTVETAWQQGAFGMGSTAADATPAEIRLAKSLTNSVVLQPVADIGERNALSAWAATPPVRNSHRQPHTNTAGS